MRSLKKLLKEAKWWFGLFLLPKMDELLTKGSEGYPLTNIDLNVLGNVYVSEEELPHREIVKKMQELLKNLLI